MNSWRDGGPRVSLILVGLFHGSLPKTPKDLDLNEPIQDHVPLYGALPRGKTRGKVVFRNRIFIVNLNHVKLMNSPFHFTFLYKLEYEMAGTIRL